MTVRHLLTLCLIVAGCAGPPAPSAPPWTETFPAAHWEQASLNGTRWSPTRLAAAEAYARRIGSTAVVIVEQGRVVAQWGEPATKSNVHSIRKSLVSALIGIAVDEGRLRLADTLAQLGIDDTAPALTPAEQQATVADLLTARSGVYHPALYETPQMAARRPPRGSHPPGTFWYYNNWDFNALGTIYERQTGTPIFAAFQQRIAGPIGMEDYTVADGEYVRGPDSIHPAYPFRLSARDLARFGLLYLREGRWQGRQIVPPAWVRASTRPYTAAGAGRGYGYLWWTGYGSAYAPTVRLPPGAYYAAGVAAQYLFVLPTADLVIVHRVNTDAPAPRVPHDRQIGRLLWLILTAAGVPDIGPDRSLAAAPAPALDAAALHRLLPEATLRYGDAAPEGPSFVRFQPEGTVTFAQGTPEHVLNTGAWRIARDQVCTTWAKPPGRPACHAVVKEGEKVTLFDADGIAYIEGVLSRVR